MRPRPERAHAARFEREGCNAMGPRARSARRTHAPLMCNCKGRVGWVLE